MKKLFYIFIIVALVFLVGVGIKKRNNQVVISTSSSAPLEQNSNEANRSTVKIKNISILAKGGVHGDFSPDDSLIVFDKPNMDGFYDVFLMTSGGNVIKSITEDASTLPHRHIGWPAWHPDGQFIVFQAEEAEHYGSENPLLNYLGSPGFGLFNNLWATTSDGNSFWELTNLPIKKSLTDGISAMAIVNPQFSHDGKKIVWTERYSGGGTLDWGWWQIKMADFVVTNNVPALTNERIVMRAVNACNTCNYINAMGFLPGDEKLLVAGNLSGQHVYGMDQYMLDIKSKKITQLMNTPEFWEEGSCLSPNGKQIVYQSNINSPYKHNFSNPNWFTEPMTREWWAMNADGSGQQQITNFNTPGSPEYENIGQGKRIITAKCKFSHDGSKMIGIIGIDQRTDDKASFILNLGSVQF